MRAKPDRVERAIQAAQSDLDGGLLLPSDDRAVLAAEVVALQSELVLARNVSAAAELRIRELDKQVVLLESQNPRTRT